MTFTQRLKEKDIIQERALKTREKVLVAALELYTDRGYHKTTVDEIAKKAGVSTGIAYRYFKNKKDLLLAALSYAFDHIKEFAGVSEASFYSGDIEEILAAFEKIHIEYRAFHEELEGLRHSDEDVKKLYQGVIESALEELLEGLPDQIKTKPHFKEKVYLMIGMMENYCHTYMEGLLSEDEIKFMREEVVRIVKKIMMEE